MKKFVLLVLMLSAFCLPSKGQIRVIDEDGKTYDGAGGGPFNFGEELFRFRVIYGRYPNDKKELLDFILDKDRYEHVDSVYLDSFNIEQKAFAKLVKKRRNKLTVSGDTCSFYVPKDRFTFQCIGGVAELQNYDTNQFQFWAGPMFYDKNGKYLRGMDDGSSYLPLAFNDLKKRFGYVVTMEPRKYYESYKYDYDEDDIIVFEEIWTPAVKVPFSMTRSGSFSYDLTCLEGIQMNYQVYGDELLRTSTIGPITLEEAFDPDYFDIIEAYMKDFLAQHEEVDRLELWEPILFKNLPKGFASQKDDLTGLSVYKLNELDTFPLCNGDVFSRGFPREFLHKFHPETNDDLPFRFTVQFVIDKNGKLLGSRIKDKTPDMLSAFEKQVLETVNQIQNWEPGKVNGVPVDVFLTVPFIF